MRPEHSPLAVLRAERDTPLALAFAALLENRLHELRGALVHAAPQEFPGLQGAARELEALLTQMRTEPAPRKRQDGAYT